MKESLLFITRILLLGLLHRIFDWYTWLNSLASNILYTPRALQAPRTKLPRHLCLLLVPAENGRISISSFSQAINVVASCCLEVGVEKLSVFLGTAELDQELQAESEILVTQLKGLSVDFLTVKNAKQLLATLAETLAAEYKEKHPTQIPPFSISVEQLDALVERQSPSPDVLLIYDFDSRKRQRPLQLCGFPPWQVCVTEIYQHRRWVPWRETLHKDLELSFRSCLDD